MTMGPDGAPKPAKTAEVFGGKRVALFAVPGAYTPTCHKQHMAGFVQNYGRIEEQEVRCRRLHVGQRHFRADQPGPRTPKLTARS
jgi:peroxiredoxin